MNDGYLKGKKKKSIYKRKIYKRNSDSENIALPLKLKQPLYILSLISLITNKVLIIPQNIQMDLLGR